MDHPYDDYTAMVLAQAKLQRQLYLKKLVTSAFAAIGGWFHHTTSTPAHHA